MPYQLLASKLNLNIIRIYMAKRGAKKVLIIDDEPDICFLFGRILLRRDLRTVYAYNLAEATQSVQEEPPSVIFLDNSLPDGQGIDFIPYLKLNFPETKVIVVTANDAPLDKKRAFQQGADDFLSKPLSTELINRTLDDMKDTNLV
jgi:two-component system, OmpR family, response regulator